MTDEELDRSYTELCHALARLGEARTASFLSTLCLALMSRQDSADELSKLIGQVERECA